MKVALLLLSHENKNGTLQNIHMPLSIGFIGEFLKTHYQHSEIEIELFKRPSKLDVYLKKNEPDIVMFGNYMWNENLNLHYAERIKSIFPEALTVFGGPNISVDRDAKAGFLKANPCIDLLLEGDAEIVSLDILISFFESSCDITATKRLSIKNCYAYDFAERKLIIGDVVDTRMGIEQLSLDDIPSPYLSGLMDTFFEDNAIPLLESNRGCPYRCTYCQQGTSYFSKIRFFEGGRIEKELDYIAQKRAELGVSIDIVEFADPNFGMFKQDLTVFNAIRSTQEKFDFPKQVWSSTGKSQAERILEYAKILKPETMMIRAAMQSMNAETLKNIERKNLAVEVFEEFSAAGVETYSDIMLGLPGETKESYINGVLSLIDSNIDEFSMPQTLVLKGTPMESKDYISKFGIKYLFRAIPECNGAYGDDAVFVTEFEQMIYETKSFSFDDYLDCRKFNLVIMIFHNTRLVKDIYKYFDFVGIRRSELMSAIYAAALDSEEFHLLLDSFITAVKDELLNSPTLDSAADIDYLTSNKVYKFLSRALLSHRNLIVDTLERALTGGALGVKADVREFFVGMLKDLCFERLEPETEVVQKKVPDSFLSVYHSTTYEVFNSDFQNDRLLALGTLYSSKEDVENKLPYHLRPSNMIKTIRFA